MGNEDAELRKEFKARLAGVFLDHLPEMRIVVRLTGNSPVSARSAVNKEGSIPIVFITGASATIDDLEASLTAHQHTLYSTIPSLQGSYVDERTGDIVLVVHATAAESKAYLAEAPALRKLLGHPFRFEFEASVSREVAYVRGGALTTTCTTGFAVREASTGRKGVLTAAHCPDAQGYANHVTPGEPGYFTFPLVFVDEKYDAEHDVQWHIAASDHTPIGEIYGASTSESYAQAILFRKTRASTMLGQAV